MTFLIFSDARRKPSKFLLTDFSKYRISELPDDILFGCISLLEMKNAARTSIISRRWRHLWTHWTHLDFDAEKMYSKEHIWWSQHAHLYASRYFGWVNQVVRMHQGPTIDLFRVCVRYLPEDATHLDEWVKFAISRRVKELVLDLIGAGFSCPTQNGYPLGFEIFKHSPCCSGITALKSLHLRFVNVSGRYLEFLLLCCPHLERLYVQDSAELSKFRVKSSTLKHLTIDQKFIDLEELVIDAENLSYFRLYNSKPDGSIVFKTLPMLVEMEFAGLPCEYPFPIFQRLSLCAIHLCKLSLDLQHRSSAPRGLGIPYGVIPIFPNLKHLTCTTCLYQYDSIHSFKRFIEACPVLQVFKFQMRFFLPDSGSTEAEELREIDLEDKIVDVEASEVLEMGVGFNYDDNLEYPLTRPQVENKGDSHANLRILELVGFMGVRTDVKFALSIVSYAASLDTIICDTLGSRYAKYTGCLSPFDAQDAAREYDVAKRRARKLAKIIAPKVKVVII